MMKHIVRFIKDEEGSAAVEYGLLVALIALLMAVGAQAMGTSLNGLFSGIAGNLAALTPGGGS